MVREDAFNLDQVRVVAGVDIGYLHPRGSTMACAAVVALAFPSLEELESHTVTETVEFPYVPGLLAFREVPPILAALRPLRAEPDVVLVDAHGYAHPRRFGAASHLGVLLDRPTIGCAKSRLIGRYEEPPRAAGAWTPLIDRGEVVGAAVRTHPGKAPLFVSIGHLVSLETAVALALACSRGNSIMPEPTRLADVLTKECTRTLRARAA